MTNTANELSKLNDIICAEVAVRHLSALTQSEVEEVWVLALSPRKKLLKSQMIFRGTVDSCLVHPRDIFRFACLQNASSILIAHNHPSGDLLPSYEDIRFTEQLLRAAQDIEIPVVDHLIVTKTGFTSMRREGWAEFQAQDLRVSSRSREYRSIY